MPDKKRLTTANGNPVDNNQNSLTAGKRGPVLMQDFHLIEKLAHFDRERIPERVVHAKGAGAYGHFEVTADVTKYTKAAFLSEVGKKTDVFLRFSTVGGEKGSADTERDPRGFALKFYTEDGIYDMVGNNTPVFFIRDPLKFPDFIHTQKRNPQTNTKDANMFWDFLSQVPESVHQVTILFSDRGTPDGYRKMNGYSSHTFMWVNAEGKGHWVKYHFKTDQGNKTMAREQAGAMASEDPDYATRDLFDAIDKGDFPSWTLKMQIMPFEDAETYRFDPFDVTKVWPHADYPLMEVGKLVLNRNPENYFEEVEQAAFSPGNIVPGIDFSPDKMLQGRIFSYGDTHRHRLGGNYQQLPVNYSKAAPPLNNQRDGFMSFRGNGGSEANYEPNTVNDIKQTDDPNSYPLPLDGVTARTEYGHENSDYAQAGALFSEVMNDEERDHLVSNIVAHLGNAKQELQERQVAIFAKAHPDYGRRVAEGLGISVPS